MDGRDYIRKEYKSIFHKKSPANCGAFDVFETVKII